MATIADRILTLLSQGGALDEDQIAARLGVIRQQINQACRGLEKRGVVTREPGWRGKIVNRRTNTQAPEPRPPDPASVGGLITEDEIKAAVQRHLDAQGYQVEIMWGKARGLDIDAVGAAGRIMIEAKGDAPTPQMQGNYFLGALGELLQRMSDPEAAYGLALPDNGRFRGLVEQLPSLAKERLHLRVYFVKCEGTECVVHELRS